jgi:hypothetical protein
MKTHWFGELHDVGQVRDSIEVAELSDIYRLPSVLMPVGVILKRLSLVVLE